MGALNGMVALEVRFKNNKLKTKQFSSPSSDPHSLSSFFPPANPSSVFPFLLPSSPSSVLPYLCVGNETQGFERIRLELYHWATSQILIFLFRLSLCSPG